MKEERVEIERHRRSELVAALHENGHGSGRIELAEAALGKLYSLEEILFRNPSDRSRIQAGEVRRMINRLRDMTADWLVSD